MLFATLDTTVRKITPEGRAPFLLSDTVGFISDLPHDLVNAFRSTLEEARLADLILEVVDCSDANCGMQMEVTAKTLADLDIRNVPVIFVMNKADLLMKDIKLPVLQADPQGERIYLSAKTGRGPRRTDRAHLRPAQCTHHRSRLPHSLYGRPQRGRTAPARGYPGRRVPGRRHLHQGCRARGPAGKAVGLHSLKQRTDACRLLPIFI
jgi:50S ribosomal subunit-associated GTPase HflX